VQGESGQAGGGGVARKTFMRRHEGGGTAKNDPKPFSWGGKCSPYGENARNCDAMKTGNRDIEKTRRVGIT